jgi:hypothetical protein
MSRAVPAFELGIGRDMLGRASLLAGCHPSLKRDSGMTSSRGLTKPSIAEMGGWRRGAGLSSYYLAHSHAFLTKPSALSDVT